MGQALHITTENFESEIIGNAGVSLVDFGATWCGPCQALAPVIEELAGEYAGKVKIGKCDVDEAQELAQRFGVMSVPTIVFFKGGKKVDSLLGNQPKTTLKRKLDGLVG